MFFFVISDVDIFGALGRKAYIRNGVGYGHISDKFLYENEFIEIGFGRLYSGFGDWGGGFSHASTCPLTVVINKNFIIQKVDTDSFGCYSPDRENERHVEEITQEIKDKLTTCDRFRIVDEEFRYFVSKILDFIPCKSHIGWDVFEHPHMLEHFTDPVEKERYHYIK